MHSFDTENEGYVPTNYIVPIMKETCPQQKETFPQCKITNINSITAFCCEDILLALEKILFIIIGTSTFILLAVMMQRKNSQALKLVLS